MDKADIRPADDRRHHRRRRTDHDFVPSALRLSVLTALALMFLALLAMQYQADQRFESVRKKALEQCEQRVKYDLASQEVRRGLKNYLGAVINTERRNPFVDDRVRNERIKAAEGAITFLEEVLDRQPPQNCDLWR